MNIRDATAAPIIDRPITASRNAVPNSAVSQGAASTDQVCAYADPAPMSPAKAEWVVLLTAPAPNLSPGDALPLQKGDHLELRV